MKLAYKATNPNGKIIQGIIEAKDVQEAAAYLRSKELLPIHIAEKRDNNLLYNLPFFNKTKGNLVYFTRQLSSMITAGLTLIQALHILSNQMENPRMKEIIKSIVTDIEDGSTLSKSIAKYPEVFSPTYVALMRAAESSGLLDKVLERLADNLEKQQRLKATIKGALIYPVVVIIGIIIVIGIMMIVVIPTLTPLYTGLKVQLPLPTRIVIGMSHVFTIGWPFMIVGSGLLWFLFAKWHKTETGKLIMDTYVLKVPIFGGLIRDSALTEITRTFGLLTSAGILIVEGLKQTADTASNILFQNALLNISHNVEKGVGIGEAMQEAPLFPPIIVEMVKVGEQTGKLDESLLRVSGYYEEEVNQKVKNLTTLMEPFIIGILGVCVAFLLFAVISPVYSIMNSIQ